MAEKEAKSAVQAADKKASTSVRNRALDGLIEAGAPWWQRYSSRGEFPWSATGSLVFHLLLVVLIIILAKGFANPDREPMGTQTVNVGTDPEAAEGEGGTDKAGGPDGDEGQKQQEQQKQEEPQPKPPMPENTPREDVKEVKPEDVPADMNAPTFDPNELPSEDISEKVAARVKQAQRQLEQLQQSQAKSGTGGKGGPNTGLGGSGGSGASGKAARAARWVLIAQGPDIRSYLAQLDGLGAAFAVPGSGDRFRYFRNVASSNRTSEERDLGGENRIFWSFEKPSMIREFCQYVGISGADMLVIFLPVEVEQRMAELERSYKGLSEDQIAQTRFRVVPKDGRYDVAVAGQTPK